MSKPREVIDLDYILDCLATLSDYEFERVVKSGKVAFVNWLMEDIPPGLLTLLARKRRRKDKDGHTETI